MTFAFSQECGNMFLELYLLYQEASGTKKNPDGTKITIYYVTAQFCFLFLCLVQALYSLSKGSVLDVSLEYH